jgi:hypothetical protein
MGKRNNAPVQNGALSGLATGESKDGRDSKDSKDGEVLNDGGENGKVKIVVLMEFQDRFDRKIMYKPGTELEFDAERAANVVSRGLAEFTSPPTPLQMDRGENPASQGEGENPGNNEIEGGGSDGRQV